RQGKMLQKRSLLVGIVVVVALVVAALIIGLGRSSEDDGVRGDPAKHAAGGRIAAFHHKTVHQLRVQAAATTTGFDSERLWGTGDDWEPAIAVDPSSSYVYQATTRYGGPKACPSC